MTTTASSHDTQAARKLQRALRRHGTNGAALQLESGRKAFAMPAPVMRLLENIIDEMALGHSVTLVPMRQELSSQEAAKLLGVSRPHLVGLLERGVIPFYRVGTHRRIKLSDVLEYQARLEALSALTREAQELHLGYNPFQRICKNSRSHVKSLTTALT
jgi:excisionase family DNA binding protein